MSAPAPLVWSNILPEDFEDLVAQAAKQGLVLSGDAGVIKHSGVEASYAYNAAAHTLTIQLTSKPFIVGWGRVSSGLTQAINSALGR